jgi:hypothetical protein
LWLGQERQQYERVDVGEALMGANFFIHTQHVAERAATSKVVCNKLNASLCHVQARAKNGKFN